MKYFVIFLLTMIMSACVNKTNPESTLESKEDRPEVVTEQDAIRYDETDSLTRALIIDSTELDTIPEKIQVIKDKKKTIHP